MPTNLINLDVTQDALVIFIDYCYESRGEEIKYFLKRQFESSQEYLYIPGDKLYSPQEVAKYIMQEKGAYHITLPDNRRLVFCLYTSAEKINKEWVAHYTEFPKMMAKLFPTTVKAAGQHFYVTCMNYSVEYFLGDAKNEVIDNLMQMAAGDFDHTQYLLYKSIVDKFDNQEEALMQVLHILSRRDFHKMINPYSMHFKKQLSVLSYSDYSRLEAQECKRKIAEIEAWIGENNDPELDHLMDQIIPTASEKVRQLEDAFDRFEDYSYLFPARVTDYTKHFLSYERNVNDGPGSMMQRRRYDFIKENMDDLISTTDYEKLVNYVSARYNYKDLIELKAQIEEDTLEDSFMRRMRSVVPTGYGDAEFQEFLENWFYCLKKQLAPCCEPAERWKAQKMQELYITRDRLESAGRYDDIYACLSRIDRDTYFMNPEGIAPYGAASIAFVSGECHTNWLLKGYDMENVQSVYYYPSISPSEVVLLKYATFVDLAGTDARDRLERILL